MLIELSANAQQDLEAIEHYIAVEGHTPSPRAAKETISKITKAIQVLRIFPRFGKKAAWKTLMSWMLQLRLIM